MTYVEPQHNAAKLASAPRGVWMTGKGREAHLRFGDARPGVVSTSESPQPQDDATTASGREERSPKARAALSEQTRNRLAVQLRAMYDDVARQPVPDRFANLIERLDGDEREKS